MEAQLNEIEKALDNLENQNDNIHSKLKELLESNREIRKEMSSLLNGKSNEPPKSAASSKNINSDMPQLQQMHNLSLNSSNNKDTASSSNTSRSKTDK